MKNLSICKLVLFCALSVFGFNVVAAEMPAPAAPAVEKDKKPLTKEEEAKKKAEEEAAKKAGGH